MTYLAQQPSVLQEYRRFVVIKDVHEPANHKVDGVRGWSIWIFFDVATDHADSVVGMGESACFQLQGRLLRGVWE
jgi:hypothetical protein